MKTKNITNKEEDKIYKSVEEALDAKHNLAKKFLAKIDMNKIASLSK